jgi:hypothetical protein
MRTRTPPIQYSDTELIFLERRKVMSRRELHAEFVEKFGRGDVSFVNLKAMMKRRGWLTGRDGTFNKGREPANKGKKMPYNANRAATQFKPGHRGGKALANYKPIGFERAHPDGYIERKIHDGLPMQSRWKFVHVIRWEEAHGPVPEGMCLKCMSEDRGNTDPSNWEAVPRGLVPRLSLKRGFDTAPEELKPVLMTLAKIEHAVESRMKKGD